MGRNSYFIIAITITIAITVGSLISTTNFISTEISFSDKIIHAVAYCILTLSWFFAVKQKGKQLKHTILIISLIFIYGIVIEGLQGVITNYRQADILDISANLAGIITAFFLYKLVFK